jgi:ABC-2 type transport system permease protein
MFISSSRRIAVRALVRDYVILSEIQVRELRTWGPITAFFTMVFPLLMLFGFGMIGGGVAPSGLVYVVTGSAIVSLVTISITAMSQDLGTMRQNGAFQYYASLPISKTALLGAILTVRVLTTLPGLGLTLTVGSWLYGLQPNPNAAVLLLLPLTVLALCGVGAAIGTLITDFRIVALVSQVAFVVAMFASPVLIPEDNLPVPLQLVGYLLPPTYAADGLRRALFGISDERLLLDLLVLTACAAGSLLGIARGLKWRLD